MKQVSKLYVALAIAMVIMMLKAPAWAVTPGTGITGSHHDWATGSHAGKFTPPSSFTGTASGVGQCTYCHTPHHALSTLLLWNQTLSTNTFSWDVPTTTGGTTFPKFSGNTYMGPTAKCLSCHDGSVAIGDFNDFETTGEFAGSKNPNATSFMPSGAQIGTNGNMAGNHPVAMPYPYQQQVNTYNLVTTGPSVALNQYQSTPIAPVILYNENRGLVITEGPVTGNSGIECTSCHDPHNDVAVDQLFLRGTLTGSTTAYICLKCHIK